MTFEVKWLKGDVVVRVRIYSVFEEAARDAEQLFPLYQKLDECTAVEVWDRNGVRHFMLEAGVSQGH